MSPGVALASLADSATAEIKIPIRLAELRFLDLALGADPAPLAVELRAEVAGVDARWQGKVVRTGASLSARNRMVEVLVQVDDPYASQPPLVPGTFVAASITGRRIDAVYTIPRAAVRDDDTVLLLDDQNRVEIRAVEVLQRTREAVLVTGSLTDGERLILTPLVTVMPGMPVRLAEGDA